VRFVTATFVALVLVLAPGAAADGGGRAESVAFGAGRLWTTVRDGVVAIDPRTGKAAPVIRTAAYGTLIAATDRTVWQLQPHSLVAVDIATHRIRLRRGLGQAGIRARGRRRRGLGPELRLGHAQQDRRLDGCEAMAGSRATFA
jgi:hypothetical protein